MRALIALTVVAMALGLSACGGDDESSRTSTAASGTSGAQGADSGGEMTASEFLDASIPNEVAAVEEAADANPDCSGVNANAGSDFQVSVAIDVANTDPDTPLSEIVAQNC